MDKEYMLKHNLMEAHKQFMRLSEGYLATQLTEAGEEDDNQPDGQEMPQMGNEMGGDGNMMPQNPGNPGQGDMPNDMQQMDGPEQPMGDVPPMGDEMPPMDNGELEPEEEDDVLDVEDLTNAQEKLNKKQNDLGHDLGEVDDRIIALLTAVEKIKGSIEKNNNDITALKAELEKRVPTQTEKLNMQSLKMYPFNVSPNEYWKDKEKEGVYEPESTEEKKEYKIKQKDIDDYSDSEIENSFDDKLHQTMKDIFKGF